MEDRSSAFTACILVPGQLLQNKVRVWITFRKDTIRNQVDSFHISTFTLRLGSHMCSCGFQSRTQNRTGPFLKPHRGHLGHVWTGSFDCRPHSHVMRCKKNPVCIYVNPAQGPQQSTLCNTIGKCSLMFVHVPWCTDSVKWKTFAHCSGWNAEISGEILKVSTLGVFLWFPPGEQNGLLWALGKWWQRQLW